MYLILQWNIANYIPHQFYFNPPMKNTQTCFSPFSFPCCLLLNPLIFHWFLLVVRFYFLQENIILLKWDEFCLIWKLPHAQVKASSHTTLFIAYFVGTYLQISAAFEIFEFGFWSWLAHRQEIPGTYNMCFSFLSFNTKWFKVS